MREIAMKSKAKLKQNARTVLQRAGWDVRRFDSTTPFPPLTSLHTAMTALLACQRRVGVVQVGANDGVLNDPLNSFLMRHRDKTDILLIEPQPHLIPILGANYEAHPSHKLANYAVGQRGTLQLHAVDERCWEDCHPPYGYGWPSYRAPTGVTSGDREYVLRWVRRYYTGPLPAEEAVTSFSVESLPLVDVLQSTEFDSGVDVLQVDTEGYDDEVLYQSSIESLAPKIINFERAALTPERFRKLANMLIALNYDIQTTRMDALAIRTAPPRS